MIKKGIGRQIVLHYVIVVFVTLFLVGGIFTVSIRAYYYDTIYDHISNPSSRLANDYENYFKAYAENDPNYFTEMLRFLAIPNTELTILNRKGEVRASSTQFQSDKPIQTSDVTGALSGNLGSKWIGRQSGTGELVMAVSTPLRLKGEDRYVIRYVTSLELVNKRLLNLTFISIGICGAVLALVTLFSVGLANSIVKPINNIRAVSAEMARGKFDTRIKGDYKYELGELSSYSHYYFSHS